MFENLSLFFSTDNVLVAVEDKNEVFCPEDLNLKGDGARGTGEVRMKRQHAGHTVSRTCLGVWAGVLGRASWWGQRMKDKGWPRRQDWEVSI